MNFAGVTDLSVTPPELVGDPSIVFSSWPPPSQELTDASPVSWVTTDDAPHVHFHAEDDVDVLPAQAQRLHDRLVTAGVASTLVLVANADHTFCFRTGCGPISPTIPEIVQQVADFLDNWLRFQP